MAFKAKIFYIQRFLSKTIREIKGRSKGGLRAVTSGYKLWLVKYNRSTFVEYDIVLNCMLEIAGLLRSRPTASLVAAPAA
jgi:hypothetical protein